MVRAELGPAERQGFLLQLKGLGMPADCSVTDPQVVHARQRVGMVRAEFGPAERLGFLAELKSVAQSTEDRVASCQMMHRRQRLRIVATAITSVECAGRFLL